MKDIILCEGEKVDISTSHYRTGHGPVYVLLVGGSYPGEIRFGSMEHLKTFQATVDDLVSQAVADIAKDMEILEALRAKKS